MNNESHNLEMTEEIFNEGIRRIKKSKLSDANKKLYINKWFNKHHEDAYGIGEVVL